MKDHFWPNTTELVMTKRGHRRRPLTRPAADLSPMGRGEEDRAFPRVLKKRGH